MRLQKTEALSILAIGAVFMGAQLAHAQSSPFWSRVGGYTLNEGLAGPATGPVSSVWYAAGGNLLLVRTESRRVFETSDFQHWKLNTTPESLPPALARPRAGLRPEAGVQIATSAARRYSLTLENIYGSDDGRLWINLTGLGGRSIIGEGFSALAVSPANPLDITATNQSGVWRSVDGGLSWQSLNEDLPNLAARSLAGQRTIVLVGDGIASIAAGKWQPIAGVAPDAALKAKLAAKIGLSPTAAAQSGSVIYAGTADGRLLVSGDNGDTWPMEFALPDSGSIDRIWADPSNSQAALAVVAARLYRTTNGGKFWDDVTGTLNAGAIHGVTADGAAGVVYTATDRGVFSGRVSLTAADLLPATWTPVSQDLPFAPALDARLNADNTLTVLLDGFGVYETLAPHRTQAPRIVNGADMSTRAAAPGSVISILGANVKQARTGQNSYPVLQASDQSSQLQVPFEVAPGVLQLTVEGDRGFWTAPLSVKQASPTIFVDGDGTPMILDAASGLVVDAGTPLHGGSVVQVLATGLGRVTPEWPTGVPAPVDSPPEVAAAVTAYLDGTPIRVTRATLAPTLVGNYLVELEIPSVVNRGAGELRIVVNGEESNRVKLYLDPGDAPQ